MNSNRKKVKCLAVLAEVQQYILQNKRDPGEVAALLQPIISEAPANTDSTNEQKARSVIDKLKAEIAQGSIKGIRSIEHSTSGSSNIACETLTYDFGDLEFTVDRKRWGGEDGESWRSVSDFLCIKLIMSETMGGLKTKTRYLDLTDDDRKFLRPYFHNARNYIEKEFLDKALNFLNY